MDKIRELTDEVEEIYEILQSPSEGMSWSSPWTKSQIKEELEIAWNRGFFEGGKLVAFIFARERDFGLEITSLGTRTECRRMGIMRQLFSEMFKMRPRSDFLLEVHARNEPAIRLYKSLGFQEIGRRKRYYNDGGDALAMKRVNPPAFS